MVWMLVLVSWAGASVLTAVLFAAVGRGALREDRDLGYEDRALREDRDLGYLEPAAGVVPAGNPDPECPAWPAELRQQELVRQELVRSSATR
jgi:hypothetical protein